MISELAPRHTKAGLILLPPGFTAGQFSLAYDDPRGRDYARESHGQHSQECYWQPIHVTPVVSRNAKVLVVQFSDRSPQGFERLFSKLCTSRKIWLRSPVRFDSRMSMNVRHAGHGTLSRSINHARVSSNWRWQVTLGQTKLYGIPKKWRMRSAYPLSFIKTAPQHTEKRSRKFQSLVPAHRMRLADTRTWITAQLDRPCLDAPLNCEIRPTSRCVDAALIV